MDITDPSSGEALDHLLIIADPPLIELLGFARARDNKDFLLLTTFFDRQKDSLSGSTLKDIVPRFPGRNLLSFYRHNKVTRFHSRSRGKKPAIRKELLDLQALPIILFIKNNPKSSSRSGDPMAITSSGMGPVEFAEHLREQFPEREIVIYVRKELSVVCSYCIPIHPVHIGIIPLFLHLFPAVLEYVFSFLIGEILVFTLEIYVLGTERFDISFRDSSPADGIDALPVWRKH